MTTTYLDISTYIHISIEIYNLEISWMILLIEVSDLETLNYLDGGYRMREPESLMLLSK